MQRPRRLEQLLFAREIHQFLCHCARQADGLRDLRDHVDILAIHGLEQDIAHHDDRQAHVIEANRGRGRLNALGHLHVHRFSARSVQCDCLTGATYAGFGTVSPVKMQKLWCGAGVVGAGRVYWPHKIPKARYITSVLPRAKPMGNLRPLSQLSQSGAMRRSGVYFAMRCVTKQASRLAAKMNSRMRASPGWMNGAAAARNLESPAPIRPAALAMIPKISTMTMAANPMT